MPAAESDSTLIALGAELAACDALKSACPDDDEERYESLYEQHWALREKINLIPADSIRGLCVKARAAELARKWGANDPEDGPGSFFDLCQSVHADIFAMAGA